MIYVTRHGRSMTNDGHDRHCKFRVDVKNNVLTEEGVLQALEYGQWLIEREADVHNLICSPYSRTKQTAYLIATKLRTLVPIHYDRHFREIEWKINGRWHRLLHEQRQNFEPENVELDERPLVDHRRKTHTLESPRQVYDRVIPAFARRVKRHAGRGDMVIVSHYFPVRAITSFVETGGPEAMRDYDPRNLHRAAWPEDLVLERVKEAGL